MPGSKLKVHAMPSLICFVLAFSTGEQSRPELAGFARLPAETFAEGPPSGAFDREGVRLAAPRFPSQVVQGFSGVQFGSECNNYWVITDNGFGQKLNSPDHLLRLYRIAPDFQSAAGGAGDVRVHEFIALRDPEARTPFLIAREFTTDRLLTGTDFDPESFARARDGSFWVGDEFGPYLLHFDADGVLLEPPYPTPDRGQGTVRSPQHPAVVAGIPLATGVTTANLPSSRGFEGIAADPVNPRLMLLLEGTVEGDPAGALRIYEFDLSAKSYRDSVRLYRLEDAAHSIGDLAAINANEYIVIERDSRVAEAARFKRLYRIDISRTDPRGFVVKELLVDLLDVGNPDLLGGFGPVFRFPFETIEGVLPIDSTTLLVLNDNNYPSRGGRGEDVTDPNELILVRLARPISLAPGAGRSSECRAAGTTSAPNARHFDLRAQTLAADDR